MNRCQLFIKINRLSEGWLQVLFEISEGLKNLKLSLENFAL